MSRLARLLVAAGLAAHALATWRALSLLAGAGALPGFAIGGLILIALDAPIPRLRARAGALAAALAVLIGAVVAPVLAAGLGPGIPAGVACALLLLAPALLAPRSDEGRPGALVVGGIGLTAASFVLPFVGPLMISVVGALLVACGMLSDSTEETRGESLGAAALLPLLAGAGCGAAMARLVASGSHPWTGLPLRLAALLVAAGLGATLASRLARNARRDALLAVAALALGILTFLPVGGDALDGILTRVATSTSHPAVGTFGGVLTLLVAALLVAAPTGLVAGLSSAPRARFSMGLATAAGVVALVVATRLASDEGGWPGHHVRRGIGPTGSTDRWLTLDGHLAAWRMAGRERDDRLAAHLASLATPERRRALALGFDPGPAVDALSLHGFTSLEIARLVPTDGELSRPKAEARAIGIAGPTDLDRLGPYDVIVSELDDPTLPAAEAFFTRQAREILRERLVPGGVLAQRLSLERLGPEGLVRQVMALEETFPGVHLATSDLGRGGTIVALCTRAMTPEQRPRRVKPARPAAPPQPSAPLIVEGNGKAPRLEGQVIAPTEEVEVTKEPPWLSINLLIGEDRLTPSVGGDLTRSLILGRDGIVETIAAGPAELEPLGEGLRPADPWRPRTDAFRHPAPSEVARELAQSLLYDRIPFVDIHLGVAPRLRTGEWQRQWPLVDIEERLGSEWHAEEAVLRQSSKLARAFGGLGAWRERGRRLRFAAPGRTLDVFADERPMATDGMLTASMAAFEGEGLKHNGQGLIHGHRFFWMFEEPDSTRQELTLSYLCPLQGNLYLEEMVITSGVRPGYYEDALRELMDNVRCIHPEAPAPLATAPTTPPAEPATKP